MGNFVGVRRCSLRSGANRAAFEQDFEALTAYFGRHKPGLQLFWWCRKGSERTAPGYLTMEIWIDAEAHRSSGARRREWANGDGSPSQPFLEMYPELERIREATENAPVEWFEQAE